MNLSQESIFRACENDRPAEAISISFDQNASLQDSFIVHQQGKNKWT